VEVDHLALWCDLPENREIEYSEKLNIRTTFVEFEGIVNVQISCSITWGYNRK